VESSVGGAVVVGGMAHGEKRGLFRSPCTYNLTGEERVGRGRGKSLGTPRSRAGKVIRGRGRPEGILAGRLQGVLCADEL